MFHVEGFDFVISRLPKSSPFLRSSINDKLLEHPQANIRVLLSILFLICCNHLLWTTLLKVKYENRQVRFICLHIPINHIPVRSCDFLLVLFSKVGWHVSNSLSCHHYELAKFLNWIHH